jgi:tetratricopeptide (TPR) repeat protein
VIKANRSYYLIFLFSLGCLLPQSVTAQRKKKPDTAGLNSSLKLREAEMYFTDAEKYFILEDYAKAILFYQRSLETYPENGTVHYRLAEIFSKSTKQEDQQRAITCIENALSLEKHNKYFYLLAIHIYSTNGRYEKAAKTYETLIEVIPNSQKYLYELATLYQFNNLTSEALQVLDKIENTFGVSDITTIQKQQLYSKQGKLKEAISEGEKLIAAYPYEERYLAAQAEFLSQHEQKAAAIPLLEKGIQENPTFLSCKMILASLYRETNQDVKAQPLLIELFENPSVELKSKLIMLRGYQIAQSTQNQKSRTPNTTDPFVEKLLVSLQTQYPHEASVHALRGDIYLSYNDPENAQNAYLEAIALGETKNELWQNLIFLEVQHQQWDSVLAHTEIALEHYPYQEIFYYYQGYAFLQKQSHEEAAFSLEFCKRLSDKNPNLKHESTVLLGSVYHALKQYDKSEAAFEEALTNNPNDVIVLNNYSYFLSLRKEKLDKAEKMALQLIKLAPDNITFLDTYAWVLYAKGKFKEAKKTQEKVVSNGKATAQHFEHFGDILFQLGESENALVQWKKAQQLSPKNELLNKKIEHRKIYE